MLKKYSMCYSLKKNKVNVFVCIHSLEGRRWLCLPCTHAWAGPQRAGSRRQAVPWGAPSLAGETGAETRHDAATAKAHPEAGTGERRGKQFFLGTEQGGQARLCLGSVAEAGWMTLGQPEARESGTPDVGAAGRLQRAVWAGQGVHAKPRHWEFLCLVAPWLLAEGGLGGRTGSQRRALRTPEGVRKGLLFGWGGDRPGRGSGAKTGRSLDLSG